MRIERMLVFLIVNCSYGFEGNWLDSGQLFDVGGDDWNVEMKKYVEIPDDYQLCLRIDGSDEFYRYKIKNFLNRTSVCINNLVERRLVAMTLITEIGLRDYSFKKIESTSQSGASVFTWAIRCQFSGESCIEYKGVAKHKTLESLFEHILVKHSTRPKLYFCSVCSQEFSYRSCLTNHDKRRTCKENEDNLESITHQKRKKL